MKSKNPTWHVYILKCSNKSLYTGIATDISRRINEHNSKRGSAYVQAHLPAKLIYQELHKTRSLALKREAQIKSLTRKQKLTLINPK